jgi:hypothetical protein
MLVDIKGVTELAIRFQLVGGERTAGEIHRHRHASGWVHHHLVGQSAVRRPLIEKCQCAALRIDVIGADATVGLPIHRIERLAVGRDPQMRRLRRLCHQSQRRDAAVLTVKPPGVDALGGPCRIASNIHDELCGLACGQGGPRQCQHRGKRCHDARAHQSTSLPPGIRTCGSWGVGGEPSRVRNASRSSNSILLKRLS